MFLTLLAVVFAQYIEAKYEVENEDVVGAPTGDASTTSEWSTIELPIKVRLILETWRYIPCYWLLSWKPLIVSSPWGALLTDIITFPYPDWQ